MNMNPRAGDDADDLTDDERYERLITPYDYRGSESLRIPLPQPVGDPTGTGLRIRVDDLGGGP